MRHFIPSLARLPRTLILTAALGLAAAAAAPAQAQADPAMALFALPELPDEAAALAELAALRAQTYDDETAADLHHAAADIVFELMFADPPREGLRAAVLDWQAELAGRVFGAASPERAEALMVLSDSLLVGLSDPTAALAPAEAAVALLRANPDDLAPLAEHLVTALANVHRGLGQPATAVPLRREALAILRADPGTHARALSARAIDLAIDLAASGTADDAEAEALLRAAVDAMTAAVGAEDFQTVDAVIELGALLAARGRGAEAAAALEPARRVTEARIAEFGWDPGRLIPQLSTLARIEIAAGNPEAANAAFLQIATQLQAVAADDPEDARDLARGVLNDLRWRRIDHPAAAALAASWPDL